MTDAQARTSGGRTLLVVGLYVAALVGTALAAREIHRQEHNTLYDNGRWESSKVGLAKGVIAAVATVTTRTALHREELNLGSWHGYQEILLEGERDVSVLDFTLDLSAGGRAAVRLDDGEEMAGLLLRGTAGAPALLFRATPEGEFTETLELAGGGGPGPHDVRMERSPDGRCSFTLGGTELGAVDGPPGAVRVGFRGGPLPALVDDVRLVERTTGVELREDFAPAEGSPAAFWVPLVVLAAAHAGLLLFLRRRLGEIHGRPLRVGLTVALVTLALAWLSYALIYWVLEGRYPDDVDFRGFETNIEFEEEICPQLLATYPFDKPAGTTRVLFIGSSQTWGAGALHEEDVAVRRIERALNGAAGDGRRYECINSGISGAQVPRLFELYRDEWSRWGAELVVINLSYNDRNETERFPGVIRSFVELNRSLGVETLLVTEPMAPGEEHEGVRANHAALRAIAREEGVALMDLQPAMEARSDVGFLNWDVIHFTSLGQRLIAEELLPRVREALSGSGYSRTAR